MKRLATVPVQTSSGASEIALYLGDLTRIAESEAVDLLVVSTFPDDYEPTPQSLVGALAKAGLSVGELSSAKDFDLRTAFGCWLSTELDSLPSGLSFNRIMVFEPRIRGRAPEVVGDLFRATTPFVLGSPNIRSVAMPVLASGDQGEDPRVMVGAILTAAIPWLQLGLPITSMKIVERNPQRAADFAAVFDSFRSRVSEATPNAPKDPDYDYFISYSRADAGAAEVLIHRLREDAPGRGIFVDRAEISIGTSWQQAIWIALESCRQVVALLTPEYLRSKVCQEEYAIGMLRHRESDGRVLLPLLVRETQLPPHMRLLDYADCRESDPVKIASAARQMLAQSAG